MLDISYPTDLPIAAKIGEIKQLLKNNQVVIVAGETGSGKSTQLPKLCLQLADDRRGMIAHTQPRRIAAREIASRLSRELGTPIGQTVGYRVRFNQRISKQTKIKVLTDGMLLSEMESDRQLSRYHTIIIDEAHERSINIDFLLGCLKRLLKRRKDLRVVITSATIDTQRFSEHFDNCPIVEVSGRTYPVELLYRPVEEKVDYNGLLSGIESAVRELWRVGSGDILIFLPGEREIRDATRFLQGRLSDEVEILSLFARLSPSDQKRIFTPSNGRRVVLSTNVAETSLTVPGVRFVVDSGLARISRYSASRKIQRLPVEKISQAAANQRKGRCGRVQSGVCVRLYAEDDFESREPFTDPEIGRTSLASIILKMKSLRLGDIEHFPFVDKPDSKQIKSGYRLLFELGALNSKSELTKIGQKLSHLPVDPRIGRLLVESQTLNCVLPMLVIASRLSVQDPQVYPPDKIDVARGHHRKFPEAESDIEGIVELWNILQLQKTDLSRKQFGQWCEKNFLSQSRLREWQEMHRQLQSILIDSKYLNTKSNTPVVPGKLIERTERLDVQSIGKALLSGFLGNIALVQKKGDYIGSNGKAVAIHPSSRHHKKHSKWIVASEMVDSGRLYARQLLPIHPIWIEQAAADLLRFEYSEPWWDKKSGYVMAWQKGMLFGLCVFERRRKNYAKINPVESRKIFIGQGLICAKTDRSLAFSKWNSDLFREAELLSQKHRLPIDVVNDVELFDFFDERLPDYVADHVALKKWFRKFPEKIGVLKLPREMIIDDSLVSGDSYPDSISVGNARIDVGYCYKPGERDDGITLRVPLPLLNQLDPNESARQFRGWLELYVESLIRCLPKALRKGLVPINQNAKMIAKSISGTADLVDELISRLDSGYGVKARISDFDLTKVPAHLQLRLELIDDQGGVIAEGRDWETLREKHGKHANDAFDGLESSGYPRTGLTEWSFGDIPDREEFKGYRTTISGFPALSDRGKHVDLRLCDSPVEARTQHRAGVRRLIKLNKKSRFREISANRSLDRCAVQYAGLYPSANITEDFLDGVIDASFEIDLADVRTEVVFTNYLQCCDDVLSRISHDYAETLHDVLKLAYSLKKMVGSALDLKFQKIIIDRVNDLIGPGFLLTTPLAWLNHLPRFLKTLVVRIEKFQRNPAADKALQDKVDLWLQRLESIASLDDSKEFRWMIEEYQVSLFAQGLGTSIPISAKRLEQKWQKLEANLR